MDNSGKKFIVVKLDEECVAALLGQQGLIIEEFNKENYLVRFESNSGSYHQIIYKDCVKIL